MILYDTKIYRLYNSDRRGIIFSDNSIHFIGNVHFEEGSSIHIGIRDMYCNTTSDVVSNVEENLSQPQYNKKIAKQGQNTMNMGVSPNPAKNNINITSKEQIESICIYTITGQCVLQTNRTDINVSALSAGIYIITAATTDSNILQAKFVKM